jgi:hypothetical protein
LRGALEGFVALSRPAARSAEDAMADRLAAMRGPDESYSDVNLRLAKA